MKQTSGTLICLSLIVTSAVGCGGSASPASESTNGNPKAVVLAFYKLALEEMKPREAFATYGAPSFIEHSQEASGTAAATVTVLEGMIARAPQSKWEIVRAAAEGDLVFLHVRYTPAPGGPEIALAEVFRVQDDKLMEHWDVISGPPAKVINVNSRF